MNIIFNILIWAVLLGLPVFLRLESIPIDSRFSRDVLFCAFSFIFTAMFYKGKIAKKYLVVFGILMAHCYVVQWRQVSMNVVLQWISVCSFSLLCLTLINNSHKIILSTLWKVLIIVGIIQNIWVCFEWYGFNVYEILINFFSSNQYLRTDLSGQKIGHIVAGSMGNSNVTASLIAICFAPVLYVRSNAKFFIGIPFIMGLIACNCMMGYGTAFAAIFFYFILERRYKTALLMFLTAIAAFFYITPSKIIEMSSGRWYVWVKSFEYFEGLDAFKLLFGQGVGFFADNFGSSGGQNFRQAHCEWIESIYAFGLLGTLAIIGMIGHVLSISKNKIASLIILATLANALGHFTLHISTTAFIFALAIAICISGKNNT